MAKNHKKYHPEYVKEVFNLVGNEYEVIGTYKNCRTKIKTKHNACGHIYPVTPHDFLSGRRCPKCYGKPRKTTDQFSKEVYNLVGDDYTVLSEYINSKANIFLRHNVCKHEYPTTPNRFLSGNRCPECERIRRFQYNTNNKKYTINEKYFSTWSNDMAYILGLIFADGNLCKSKFRLRIDLIDKELLKDINKRFKSNRPIRKSSNPKGEWYTLSVDNKQIYTDLINLGVTPNKTFTCSIPSMPPEYVYDFIRGYFDGDGCVYSRKRKDCIPSISIDIATASSAFKEGLLDLLDEITDENHKFSVQIRTNGLYIIRCNTVVSGRFYDKIYYDNCLHLKRKKDKFDSILDERLKNKRL